MGADTVITDDMAELGKVVAGGARLVFLFATLYMVDMVAFLCHKISIQVGFQCHRILNLVIGNNFLCFGNGNKNRSAHSQLLVRHPGRDRAKGNLEIRGDVQPNTY